MYLNLGRRWFLLSQPVRHHHQEKRRPSGTAHCDILYLHERSGRLWKHTKRAAGDYDMYFEVANLRLGRGGEKETE
jgi:hypothetical protein